MEKLNKKETLTKKEKEERIKAITKNINDDEDFIFMSDSCNITFASSKKILEYIAIILDKVRPPKELVQSVLDCVYMTNEEKIDFIANKFKEMLKEKEGK